MSSKACFVLLRRLVLLQNCSKDRILKLLNQNTDTVIDISTNQTQAAFSIKNRVKSENLTAWSAVNFIYE